MHERDILLAALEKARPEEREAYLTQACGEDAELRSRVDALLRASEVQDSFLERPAFETEVLGRETDAIRQESGAHGDTSLDFLHPLDDPQALGRLGQYTITEVIGRGGMGVVLKARDTKLNRVVAIKVLAPELASNPTARKRFQREAHAAAAVVHQHVVTIHAVDEDRVPYLVMECIDGQSLKEKIDREGHLKLIEILRIGQQVASGLAAAHAHGLMHRDVKPANILLENGVERVRITDFGLARAVDDVGMTRTGEVAGTPEYMSPEQAQGLTMDGRSDLFSFGCVLYAMCTGRPPFRAETAFATARRVCDDTPRPIREVNPEIPEWLVAIIDRLLAKQPDERFQTAAEVTDLLGQRLAELQHPALPAAQPATASNSAIRNPNSAFAKRPWVIAAAALALVLLLCISLTEATGVTQVMPTIIRIVTGEGTLVIRTDPDVQVTVEGNGNLVFRLGGGQTIRVPTGPYRVRATKDGKPISLERDLITIERGGEQVVRVRMEPATSTARAVEKSERGAFVVLGGKGVAERKFDTLADAVNSTNDGDTIEIRGNGPFLTPPLHLKDRALTIRSGAGFRPVIKLGPEWVEQNVHLLDTKAALVLEGLELHRVRPGRAEKSYHHIIQSEEAPIRAANCRFVLKPAFFAIRPRFSPLLELRNCEFLLGTGGDLVEHNHAAVFWSAPSGGRCRMENCVSAGQYGLWLGSGAYPPQSASVVLARNTLVAREAPLLLYLSPSLEPHGGGAAGGFSTEASTNVFDGANVCLGSWYNQPGDSPTTEAAVLRRSLSWKGDRNQFSPGSAFTSWAYAGTSGYGIKDLTEWNQFWRQDESGCSSGKVRYQGGDLLSRVDKAPEELTPDDFRVRADSAGYRAGPDGKDLGADIDLVGPGPAYERWKKTPEYQEWLKETKQATPEVPTAERGAFVVLGGTGVAERKFDTLAAAVAAASDSETIEVRGSGPFICESVVLDKALTIRAAEGLRPILTLSAKAVAVDAALIQAERPLVLEGLELRRSDDRRWQPGIPARCVVRAREASLRMANCRFLVRNGAALLLDHTAMCHLHNCEFLGEKNVGVFWNCTSGNTLHLENCILLWNSIYVPLTDSELKNVRLHLRHSSFVSDVVSIDFNNLAVSAFRTAPDESAGAIQIESIENVFDTPNVFRLNLSQTLFDKITEPFPLSAAQHLAGEALAWRADRTLYRTGAGYVLGHTADDRKSETLTTQLGAAEWKKWWGPSDANRVEDVIAFEGNPQHTFALEKLTPADFRLSAGRPGTGAGKQGQDLGADVDLVGPGPAYERWKKTPEYQTWIKDTGQLRAEIPRPETGAFVLLGGKGVAERKFDTLAEAVQRASAGDTIEVRGNGPFVTGPIKTPNAALAIRAGDGYRPVIEAGPDVWDVGEWIWAFGPLVLEGLEFRGGQGKFGNAVKVDTYSPLSVAHCRFDFPVAGVNPVHAGRSTHCTVRHCEFLLGRLANHAVVWLPGKDRRLVVDGCTIAGRGLGLGLGYRGAPAEPCSVDFTRNTVTGDWSINLMRYSEIAAHGRPLSLRVADNVLDCPTFMILSDRPEAPPLAPAAALAFVKDLVAYEESRNVHAASGRLLWYTGKDWTAASPDQTVNDLEAWQEFWGMPAASSRTGSVHLQGGAILARATENSRDVTPADFRLRADSAGYQSGDDGKDLGADVDLVGPGAAYERWKATPEYQEWLKETGQKK